VNNISYLSDKDIMYDFTGTDSGYLRLVLLNTYNVSPSTVSISVYITNWNVCSLLLFFLQIIFILILYIYLMLFSVILFYFSLLLWLLLVFIFSHTLYFALHN
jgi:hypothetical protein